MEIARPFLLLLLLLLPVLYYGYRRSLVDLTRTQRIVSLIVRAIIIALLILSAADLQYLKTDDELAVIFVADISDSISTEGLETSTDYINEALESKGVGQQASVIGFTDRSEILKDFRDESEDAPNLAEIKGTWLEDDEDAGDATNIAQAIEMAWGVFPANANKRIVLVTDGVRDAGRRDSHGAPRTGLRRADRHGAHLSER